MILKRELDIDRCLFLELPYLHAGPTAQGVPDEAMSNLPSTTLSVLEGLPSIDGEKVICPLCFCCVYGSVKRVFSSKAPNFRVTSPYACHVLSVPTQRAADL